MKNVNDWRGWYGALMQNYRSTIYFQAQKQGEYQERLDAKIAELRWAGHAVPKGAGVHSILFPRNKYEDVFKLSCGCEYVVARDGSWRKQHD